MPKDNLKQIKIEINRLRTKKAALKLKIKKNDNKRRKLRTRTLIQLGGLLDLTPLLSICGIELGDDLQIEHQDKAAILLGILITAATQLPDTICDEELSQFKQLGAIVLKNSV